MPGARWTERLGEWIGAGLAPLAALGSLVRRARILHPDGVVYRAEVTEVATTDAALARLGKALAGPALVRFSSAWWKRGPELPDVLGLALRLRSDETVSAEPGPRDQDLLFATIRWPLTTLLAPLSTDAHSFLHDDYHGVSPFRVEGLGRVKLRLRTPHRGSDGQSREQALASAVASGRAELTLQVRRLGLGRYRDVAVVRLRAPVLVDQEALRFSPFRCARGVRPVGFIHALRRATYAASQLARPSRTRVRARAAGTDRTGGPT